MPFAIAAFVDPDADAAIRAMWAVLEKLEIPSLDRRFGARPCLLMAKSSLIDSAGMRLELRRFASALKPFPIELQAPCVRTEAMCSVGLPVSMSTELKAVHDGLHRFVHKVVQSPRAEFSPSSWQPIVLLAEEIGPNPAAMAVQAVSPMAIPQATVVEIACIQTNPARDHVVFTMNLESGIFRDRG